MTTSPEPATPLPPTGPDTAPSGNPSPATVPAAAAHDPAESPDNRLGEPALSVAALARRLGVAPATLRTWDRRYGVGPSGHTTGRHRRYGAADIARLELMRRALLRGASPAEAARYALQATAPDPPGPAVVPRSARPSVRLTASTSSATDSEDGDQPAGSNHTAEPSCGAPAAPAEADALVVEGDFRPAPGRRAASGGRGLKLPGASRAARGLGRAVLAMDSPGAQRLLADAFDGLGVVAAWSEVIAPVAAAILARWETSGRGLETDHLLRECVLSALLRVTPVVSTPRNVRPVLVACVPREPVSLPLYALVAALAARDIGTRMLGAALPADALASAIRRTAPVAVVLWAQAARHADPDLAARLPTQRTRCRLLLAGPGWPGTGLRGADQHGAGGTLPDDLGAATEEIERVAIGI